MNLRNQNSDQWFGTTVIGFEWYYKVNDPLTVITQTLDLELTIQDLASSDDLSSSFAMSMRRKTPEINSDSPNDNSEVLKT